MKILFFHASAGQGHKKAAEIASKVLLERANPPVNIQTHDALDWTSPSSKKQYLDFYFYCVKFFPNLWGWFYDFTDRPSVYSVIQPFRRLFNSLIAKNLVKKILEEKPDVIVSTHFLASEVVAHLKCSGKTTAKLITIITDFMPHTTWINPGTDFYWVMSEETKKEVMKRGVPESSIFAKGIPVSPIFKPQNQKEEVRAKYGLDKKRFTILLTSGSFGFASYESVLRNLEAFREQIQCLVVCGNNSEVEKDLSSMTFAFPVKVFGFVNFMADLMEASDLMIAKSGGLTSSEGLAKGIPMIVTQPIPGQETRNVDFLKFHEAAFFIQAPSQIKLIVENILKHPHLLEMKKSAIARIAKPNASEDLADFIVKLCPQKNT